MRCSGDGQITGDTWDRQHEIIHKYAAANAIEIIGWDPSLLQETQPFMPSPSS